MSSFRTTLQGTQTMARIERWTLEALKHKGAAEVLAIAPDFGYPEEPVYVVLTRIEPPILGVQEFAVHHARVDERTGSVTIGNGHYMATIDAAIEELVEQSGLVATHGLPAEGPWRTVTQVMVQALAVEQAQTTAGLRDVEAA